MVNLGIIAKVKQATNSYVNYILMNETTVPVVEFLGHLKRFWLTVKPSEIIDVVLEFKLKRDKMELGQQNFRQSKFWPRDGESFIIKVLF